MIGFSPLKKIKSIFGLTDSFVVLKILEVSSPPPKYYPDIEKCLYSGALGSIEGVSTWNQGSNTDDRKPTIEVVFRNSSVTVAQIVEHFKKNGLITEPIREKIRE